MNVSKQKKEVQKLLKHHGIKPKLLSRTPEQNELSERLNRTFIEKTRSMLFVHNTN